MKKVLFSLFFFCFSLCLNAQVSYGNATWGTYYMQINVVTENDSVFLNMTFTSEDRKITDHPKLLLRFMDDSMISLEGVNVSSVQKNEGGLIVYGLLLSSDYFISEAKFPISKEQISLFGKGVKKSLIPQHYNLTLFISSVTTQVGLSYSPMHNFPRCNQRE